MGSDGLVGNGQGSFAPPITTTIAGYPDWFVLADFNADGFPDAAVTNSWDSGSVSIFRNDGTWPPEDPPSVSIRDLR